MKPIERPREGDRFVLLSRPATFPHPTYDSVRLVLAKVRSDAETLDIWRRYAALRERAVPYLQRLFRTAARTGIPPARPLWLAYPGDREAAVQDQEWMLGPDGLVAPVVTDGARTRRVYLPRGCWREANGGRRRRGGRAVTVEAPLAVLPYFVRCGRKPF